MTFHFEPMLSCQYTICIRNGEWEKKLIFMNIRCFFYVYAVFRMWKQFYGEIPQHFFDDTKVNSRVEMPVKPSHRLRSSAHGTRCQSLDIYSIVSILYTGWLANSRPKTSEWFEECLSVSCMDSCWVLNKSAFGFKKIEKNSILLKIAFT